MDPQCSSAQLVCGMGAGDVRELDCLLPVLWRDGWVRAYQAIGEQRKHPRQPPQSTGRVPLSKQAAPTVPSSSGICSTAAAVGGGDGGSGDVGWGSTAGASAARGTRSCCCCLCSWGQQAGREMQQCSGGGGARGQAGGEGLQHIHCHIRERQTRSFQHFSHHPCAPQIRRVQRGPQLPAQCSFCSCRSSISSRGSG